MKEYVKDGVPYDVVITYRDSQAMAVMNTVKEAGMNIPDDIKKVIYDVLSHRLILTYDAKVKGVVIQDVIKSILKEVKEPKIKI